MNRISIKGVIAGAIVVDHKGGDMFKKIALGVIGMAAFVGGMKYSTQHHVLTNAEFAQVMATAANLKASTMLDQETRFDGATASGSEVLYSYTLVHVAPGQSLDGSIPQRLHAHIQSKDCANEKVRSALERGITMRYTYKNSGGIEVINTSLNIGDCSS